MSVRTTVEGPLPGTPSTRRRIPWYAVIAVAVVAALLVASLLARSPARTQDLAIGVSGPSGAHPLGTDGLGRDVALRLLAGAWTALLGPLAISVGALGIGLVLGLAAGYRRGLTDTVVMRWADLMYALPPLLVAIVVAGVIGGGYGLAVGVILLLTIPYDTRIVRGATLAQASLPYVEAAVTLGASRTTVMFRHLLPNVLPVALANTFLNFAFSLVSLSALSYLGLGAAPGSPDWGASLADGQSLLFDNPWVALAPGLMLVAVAVIANLLGDRLGDQIAGAVTR